MASWQDGPEYAPVEPPDQFRVPDVPPLADPQPTAGPPAAPHERPQFGDPPTPVAPLATLSPADAAEHRDPRTPYRIESMTMADSDSGAWSAVHAHSPTAAAEPAAAAGSAMPTWRPPGQPLPDGAVRYPADAIDPGSTNPDSALARSNSPAPGWPGPEQRPQTASNFPAPGTPGWFGPGPAPAQQPPPPPSLGQAVPTAAIIALAAAILVVTAPFAFVAGFLLTLTAAYARRQLMIAWAIVAGSILLISALSTLSNYGDLTGWYGAFQVWSLVGSLLMIMLIVVIVNHQIKQPPGPGRPVPGPDRTWPPPANDWPQQSGSYPPLDPSEQPPNRQGPSPASPGQQQPQAGPGEQQQPPSDPWHRP
jgi:uncharacterized membrane protein YphA (DoxX/SURF4 family)